MGPKEIIDFRDYVNMEADKLKGKSSDEVLMFLNPVARENIRFVYIADRICAKLDELFEKGNT